MLRQPTTGFIGIVDKFIERDNQVRQLERMIKEHDCHLSDVDGCKCLFWKEDIRKIKGEKDSIIQ